MDNDNNIRVILELMQDAPNSMKGDYSAVWHNLEQKLEKPRQKRNYAMLMVAAVLILSISLGVLFLNRSNQEKDVVKKKFEKVKSRPHQTMQHLPTEEARQISVVPNTTQIASKIKAPIVVREQGVKPAEIDTVPFAGLRQLEVSPILQVLPVVNSTPPPIKRLRIVHLNELRGDRQLEEPVQANKVKKEEKSFSFPANIIPTWKKKDKSESTINEN